jgi:hypothetical protein
MASEGITLVREPMLMPSDRGRSHLQRCYRSRANHDYYGFEVLFLNVQADELQKNAKANAQCIRAAKEQRHL